MICFFLPGGWRQNNLFCIWVVAEKRASMAVSSNSRQLVLIVFLYLKQIKFHNFKNVLFHFSAFFHSQKIPKIYVHCEMLICTQIKIYLFKLCMKKLICLTIQHIHADIALWSLTIYLCMSPFQPLHTSVKVWVIKCGVSWDVWYLDDNKLFSKSCESFLLGLHSYQFPFGLH